ncbi:MAG: conjugal transfer protein TraC [Pseudomonadota bacterium]
MKKPSRQIREEIARLQDQLKAAETREAERIGRVALRAGLGDLEIDEADLLTAFEEVKARFRKAGAGPKPARGSGSPEPPGAGAGASSEA